MLNSQDRIFIVITPQFFGIFLRKFTDSFPAHLGVGIGQLDTKSLFLDFKSQATLLVIVGLLAEIGVLNGVFSQTIFECGIMSHDLSNVPIFVKIDDGCLLFLERRVFIKPPD